MKNFKSIYYLIAILFAIGLSSCHTYSVRLVSRNVVAEEPPVSNEGVPDFYVNKVYGSIDTILRSKVFEDNSIGLVVPKEKCPSGVLYSVEYRNTLGGTLLYLVTFGSRRKVKLTYVCGDN